MIQVSIPKEHPYSSHISRFAVFPSFHSPDDPHTGVRAASQASLNHLIPASAPQVRVSSKTMGAPYRQEILDVQKTSRSKGVVWPGEHGFLDHTKPVKADGQVFYPTPPKTVLPNPKLRDWEVSLSGRTANMLKNVAHSHWISSYQLQYTGSGPANPLKMDDLNEKILGGVTAHNAPLRERSQPTFVPSKPRGHMASRRKACLGLKTTLHPSTTGPTAVESVESEHLNQSRSLIPASACTPNIDTTASIYDSETQEITAKTVSPHVAVRGRDQTEWIATKTGPALLFQELLHGKQSGRKMVGSQPENKEAQCETGENETGTFMYDESHTEANRRERNTDKGCSKALWSHTWLSQEEPKISNEKSVNDALVLGTQKHNFNFESNQHIQNQSVFAKNLVSSWSMSSGEWSKAQQKKTPVSILPRYKVPFNMQQVVHEQTPFSQCLPSLLEVQESFNKSEAHRRFNASITLAPVDLRDSIGVGKKHKFDGINCNYLHG
ncbi:hypothetical protein N1851_020106 [Merluccius polli]|uniref:Uncharacterized protein n=1 Tax=Merluccius polli TaxID=89951 RepID=A0AA47MLD2_MERPO|nr:hypothetical protein N1851_020106 [Merluccius polli]